jgi:hypothetical protein
LIHPFAVSATPGFLAILMVYLVLSAFARGFYPGVRSLAGILFPLIMVTFVFIFQRELLERLGTIPLFVSFAAALILGVLVMVVVQVYARSPTVPVTELVLSGSFSLLVFSYASLRGNKMLSYYYGMIAGFLLYIICFGFPSL